MKNTNDIVDAPIHNPETDYHFSEGSYFSPQFKILGATFMLIGLTQCLNMNFFGLILLILGLISLLAKKELTISFSLARYRYAFVIFGLRSGKWITLPEFESISMFSAKKSQGMASGSQSATFSYSEIEVNLVYNRSRRLTVYLTKDFSKALEIARKFAAKFELSIYDATKREGEWIE